MCGVFWAVFMKKRMTRAYFFPFQLHPLDVFLTRLHLHLFI